MNATNEVVLNDPRCAGQRASMHQELVGSFSRFAVFPIHTRFDRVCWIVTDAERADDLTREPMIVGQCDTREDAIARALAVESSAKEVQHRD